PLAPRGRRLSTEFHPRRVQRVGLIDSLERLCQDITKRHGIQVTFQPGRLPDSIPKEVELCLFRVAQEALGNVVKHSGAFHTSVVLHQTSDGLRLYIADDGVGFDTRGLSEKTCIGMLSMCERLNQSHGKFDVESSPGGGTRITAVIPEGDDEAL
ncbi:MAG: ATP-binding protein, partial [Myxococcota bacterium]